MSAHTRPALGQSSNAVLTTIITAILVSSVILEVQGEILTPPYFNLASGKRVTATATCGEEGPELYCKLVGANAEKDIDIGHVIQGQVCDYCDSNNETKRHPPEYAADGMETWWQSPPLSRGMKYNEVNLTIDLGQEFHVAYVFVRMGNSPRPGLWALEKSSDYGKTYKPWQYFSDSQQDCEIYFGKDSLLPISKDDSVICSTEYSQIVPLEGGEIPISLLNYRPSANMYFNSSVLQEWTRATNVRLRLLRTKNLLAHLMSVARQDPTVTRRYFYSIKDISIGGRCMCNGHADICYPESESSILQCRCQHYTCGPQCAQCCPGYEQKKWKISQHWNQFSCEPCNCHNHTSECTYNPLVDANRLSLDIHGRYEGGGECQNCQHNTEGINCNKCKPTFYRPYGKLWNETDVCQPCNCNYHYSTGNCEEGTGQCECRLEFNPPRCDSCRIGYFDYPNCKPCTCNMNGTEGNYCTPLEGTCPCKYNYAGQFCTECQDRFYSADCNECECNTIGSVSSTCDKQTGNCTCKSKYSGRTCSQCEAGFYDYPTCTYCNCDNSGTKASICDSTTGQCICREGFGGARCDQCIAGYFMELKGRERSCVPCNCSTTGSASTSCAVTGKCTCLSNFGGKQCDQCSPGHYSYPDCLSCNCDQYGAIGVSCDDNGQCHCMKNFDKLQCNTCKEHFYNYPACEECNCDPNGVIASFAGCGSVPAGELCQCKDRVQGRICNDCKPLFWNLQEYNPLGCEDCDCNLAGIQGGIGVCNTKSGQCSCKVAVGERSCNQCLDGFYNLTATNVFGCTDCDCDIGGSVDDNCDKTSGQCKCHSRIDGRRCSEPIQAHYFPTLHQFQFEVENGRTPSNQIVRYDFSEETFPGFSWKGYAIFSTLQNEVINDVQIHKSSLYRMVVRYVNPTQDNIVASIVITPDNPSDVQQKFSVLLKPTASPQFVTVSGEKGGIPAPFVMNPGKWEVTLKTNRNVYIDYFVLIPQAYYEATVLTKQVEKPCIIGEQKLCRHFAYPNLSAFSAVKGSGSLNHVTHYIDNSKQLQELDAGPMDIPIISEDQNELNFEIIVNKPGPFIFLIEYVTPVNSTQPAGGTISIKVTSDSNQDGSYATVNLNNCAYSSPCRQVLVDQLAKVQVIDIQDNVNNIAIQGEPGTLAGIKTIVAIPEHLWHLDYVTPRPFCVKKNGQCTPAVFSAAVDSKKVEFESASADGDRKTRPYILDNSTEVVYLHPDDSHLDVESKVPAPGVYTFVVHYYQPDHPESRIDVILQNEGQFTDAILPITHCPSNSGCRAILQMADGNTHFPLTENFDLSFKEKSGKGVWLDYFLIVASDDYVDTVLKEANTLDYTREFITTCAQNHYHVNITDEGFCRDSIFSITSNYNNGALQCFCDQVGSTSFHCDKFGGQCECKPDVIGRTCKQCRTGYYGFPNCRQCDCPSKALCADDGSCICPRNVEGEQCDRCKSETYGFDIVVGCSDCNCHSLGVVDNKLQCDLTNGNCSCKENVIGRMCDRCLPGHYSFPYCSPCNCHLPGSTDDVCDQDTAECFCKQNTIGQACDTCKEGHFDLQPDNPEGCTKCFCFDKTTRCTSSGLIWAQINGMEDWYLVNLDLNANGSTALYRHSNPPQQLNATVIGAELATDEANEKVVYFGAPQQYLGHRLSTYGGYLNFTIFYTTGPFGNAIPCSDVILEGPAGYIVHNSVEQPPATIYWAYSLHLIESEFSTLDGGIVKREQLMTTLQNLKALYIRATYWETSVTTRLEGVSLDVATDMDWSSDSVQATSVEDCTCPSAYKGLSCEQCAEGHYRLETGPHGGFCVPCQCHGHSNTCDVNTGICLDCDDYTTGDRCEQCIAGYHGNATVGTPNDCLICACPLPIVSNNFANSCEVSPDGLRIACQCPEGYAEPRCDYCTAGFYGQPTQPGDFCKPCNCSGNIDATDPGSCDSINGDCLKCANNTSGQACNICAPGFYGDAVLLKNCQACICAASGTDHCDDEDGVCVCKPGVVGDKCDRCELEHWGLGAGRGCRPCGCGEASDSRQCDEENGQCRCAKGVTGQKCDVCAAGYWNYTKDGCDHCNCNTGYSVGFRCNELDGHCECLPGAIGAKCENCPHRWVLIPKVGCERCDSCTGDLLDSVDALNVTLAPVALDFKSKANSYFTTQGLRYISENVRKLKPLVAALDPRRVDLVDVTDNIVALESGAKNLERKAEYAKNDGDTNKKQAGELVTAADEVLNAVREVAGQANQAVRHVADLATSLELGEQPKIDSALDEAKQILSIVKEKDLSPKLNRSREVLQSAHDLEERMKVFTRPVAEQNQTYQILLESVSKFKRTLDEMLKLTDRAHGTVTKASLLSSRNRASKFASKVTAVDKQNNEAYEDIVSAAQLIANASMAQGTAMQVVQNATKQRDDSNTVFGEMDSLIRSHEQEKNDLFELVEDAKTHKESLENKADILNNLLEKLKNNGHTQNAYAAASAYSSIVQEIQDAKAAAADAEEAINQATVTNQELARDSNPKLVRSQDLNERGLSALRTVRDELSPEYGRAEDGVRHLGQLTQGTEDAFSAIQLSLMTIPASLAGFENLRQGLAPSDTINSTIQSTVDVMRELGDDLPASRVQAQSLPKITNEAGQTINHIKTLIDDINNIRPNIARYLGEVERKQTDLERERRSADDNLEVLRKQIEHAKSIANRIKVGVEFDEMATLQPETPENVDEMGTSTHVSAYFRTAQENGFLLYLGNPEGTKLRRTRSDDFMALEIGNGFPYLIIDIGDAADSGREPARINSNKKVSDNKWYQVVVDRVGKNVKLTIREKLDNGTELMHTTERVLPGQHTIFNLDKQQSKLYVGGYPSSAKMQGAVRFSSFNGQIEEVVVGDTPVGLWNFVQAEKLRGARERDRLINTDSTSSYRFNGEGYVSVDARSYIGSPEITDISLAFRTYAPDGLLYLLGTKQNFFSLEMRGGNVFLQYRLSEDIVTIGTTQKFNDGNWHRVTAKRHKKAGSLEVDRLPAESAESSGTETSLHTEDYMYFGGFPRTLGSLEGFYEVINKGFDGCIEDVSMSGTLVDLTQNVEAYGVTSGCQFASLVSLDGDGSFLRYQNSTSDNFQLSLKFKTAAPDGLIFYSTNRDQSSGISLALEKGKLVLRSQKEPLDTGSNTYNDDQWHVVTATHSSSALKLVVDDYDYFSTDTAPQPLHIVNGELFLGGCPRQYVIVSGMTASRQPFGGCLGDATVNGQVVNFGAAWQTNGSTVGRCGKLTSTSGVAASDTNRPTLFHEEVEGRTDVPLPEVPATAPPTTEYFVPEPRTTAAPTATTPTTTTAPTPSAAPAATPTPTPATTTTKRPAPVVEHGCALGFDPTYGDSSPDTGYRFGTRLYSRVEFSRLPSRQNAGYDLSVQFNTSEPAGGLMLYATDASKREFVALFMRDGQLHLLYNCGGESGRIAPEARFADGAWHTAALSLEDGRGKLSVDDALVGETAGRCAARPAVLQPPVYLGGLAERAADDADLQSFGPWSYSPFNGCLKKLEMNGQAFTEIGLKQHVLPCRQSSEEYGVFFRPPGGYLRLMERFKVGLDMSISLEIKARNTSGLLVAVHGRKDYLVLEVVDSQVILNVENGKGPIRAVFNLGDKFLLCDGEWHKIHAIKSRHVVSLVVDGHFSDAGVGQSPSTDTRSALYVGGHPSHASQQSLRGAASRHGFTGCIRNIVVKEAPVPIPLNATYGAVAVGACPAD